MECITSSCDERLGAAGRQSAKYIPQSPNAPGPNNVPPPDRLTDSYFQKMMRVSSTEIYVVPAKEIEGDFLGPLPSLAEWLKSRCGELSSAEENRLIDLRVEISMGRRVRDLEFDELEKKDQRILSCRGTSMRAEREGKFKAYFAESSSSPLSKFLSILPF